MTCNETLNMICPLCKKLIVFVHLGDMPPTPAGSILRIFWPNEDHRELTGHDSTVSYWVTGEPE